MSQTNGWRAQPLRDRAHDAAVRRREIARLQAMRVPGTEYTAAEHAQIQADLKADYYTREARRRAA